MKVPILGIDLGTTNTCLSIYTNKPEILLIDNHRTFPSIYNSSKDVVGHEAKKYLTTDPKNTFFATKRLLGKKFDDQELKKYLKSLPFNAVSHVNGDIWLKGSKLISPIKVASKILSYAKDKAENFLKKEVKDVVITVPAYFDDSQRQATKTAANIAGLNVLRIINEPTAAALAYGLNKEGTVAVFDLGGGTFDISILKIKDGVFQVLSTNGNTFLGGEDVDYKIKELVLKKINQKIPESSLKLLTEQIKVKLSLFKEVKIIFGKKDSDSPAEDVIENINKEIDHVDKTSNDNTIYIDSNTKASSFVIERGEIEKIAEEIIKKTVKPCKQALMDAELESKDITNVILVGGMTRMPFVRNLVQEIFNQSPILVDPDVIVAQGAAIQANSLQNESSHLLLDVNSLSLGIETIGGVFSRIIKRNSPLPTKRTQIFTTSEDFQEEIIINIFQGERPLIKHNKNLGSLKLKIPPQRKNVPKIEITFETDIDGILKISAKDIITGNEVTSTLFLSSGLTNEELKEMIFESEKNQLKDKEEIKRMKIRNNVIDIYEKLKKINKSELIKEIYEEVNKKNFCIRKIENKLKQIKI